MFQRSAQLELVAENDHFACSGQSIQIDVLDLKTCQKVILFGTFSGRVGVRTKFWVGKFSKIDFPKIVLERSQSVFGHPTTSKTRFRTTSQ